MVDVGSKDTTKRMARAIGIVDVGETAYNLIANNQVKGMNFKMNSACLKKFTNVIITMLIT